ncbi:hypothetical protein [Actinoplanes sp. NPDC026619]|uniref:hypothetical protein n=1 Tax=Actinoplanes sp. NPDC026619 TaxID=3155798 RepID=UPI0033D75FC0
MGRKIGWIIATALAWTLNPAVLFCTLWPTGFGRDCASPPGQPDVVPAGCPREGLTWLAGMFFLALWVLLTFVIGLVLGAIEGAHRQFASGALAVVCAVLVTIAMPWAMAGFAVSNGVTQLIVRAKD